MWAGRSRSGRSLRGVKSRRKREGQMRRREFIAGVGAAVWPVSARAQQLGVPVIGYLRPRNEDERWWAAFRRGLGEQGYVEGRNVEILRRDAVPPYDRVPELAA